MLTADVALAGLLPASDALAGALTRPLWPGATRHVQSESLKAPRPVSLAGSHPPAVRSVTERSP